MEAHAHIVVPLALVCGQVVPVPFSLRSEDSIRAAIGRSNVVINLIGEPEGWALAVVSIV